MLILAHKSISPSTQRALRVMLVARASSTAWHGHMKDYQVQRPGEILKQALNKASPAAAITLCNKPGKERTLPPQLG